MKQTRKYQNEIEKALTHGGYLDLGRCSWSFKIGEHKSETGLGTVSTTLSGYYDANREPSEDLRQRCLDAGVPVIDSRHLTLDQAFEYIKGPLIHCSKSYPAVSGDISLSEFVNSKRHLGVKFFNIEGVSQNETN